MTWSLYEGDCVEIMRDHIPNEYIDLTVTSPPYDNLRTYNGFNVFNFESTAKELYRVTKTGGVVVWVVGDATIKGSETGTCFKQALFFKSVGFNLHDTMIYHKDNPPPVGGVNRYYQAFEYMFVFSKGTPILNPIVKERRNKWNDKRTARFRAVNRNAEGIFTKKEISVKEIVKIQNVWTYTVSGGSSATDRVAYRHPAIFPEQLAYDHIISWSSIGDLILDPFAGSGTTLKVAENLGRNSIGIDINSEYCTIIRERMNTICHDNTY